MGNQQKGLRNERNNSSSFNIADVDIQVQTVTKVNKITFLAFMQEAPEQIFPPSNNPNKFNPGFMFRFVGMRTGALPGVGGPQGVVGDDDEVQVWIEDPRACEELIKIAGNQKFKITIEPVP